MKKVVPNEVVSKSTMKKTENQTSSSDEHNVKSAILDVISDSKSRFFEIFVTTLFLCIGLVFFLLGLEPFWTLPILLFGALWNYFTNSNRLFACIFAFAVCVPYSLYAIQSGLYGQAFLHLILYIPTQLMFYYQERNNEDLEIKREKHLDTNSYILLIVFALFLLFSVSAALYTIEGQLFFWLDALTVMLLAVSVFLVNGKFREYWIQRLIAVASGFALWIVVGVNYNWSDGSMMFALLFAMYFVVDLYRAIVWYKENYGMTYINEKKLEKLKKFEFEEKERKELVKSKKLPK